MGASLRAVICDARNAGDRMRGLSGDTGIELKIQNSSLRAWCLFKGNFSEVLNVF